jgi:hypothetical protein
MGKLVCALSVMLELSDLMLAVILFETFEWRTRLAPPVIINKTTVSS